MTGFVEPRFRSRLFRTGSTYDHALCVNTADPMFETLRAAYGERIIAFADTEPTTEVLAKTFFDAVVRALGDYAGSNNPRYPLRDSVRVVNVRVWETSSSWAEYSESYQA